MSPGAARFAESATHSPILSWWVATRKIVQVLIPPGQLVLIYARAYQRITYSLSYPPTHVRRDVPSRSKRLNGQLHCHSNALPLAGALHDVIAHLSSSGGWMVDQSDRNVQTKSPKQVYQVDK